MDEHPRLEIIDKGMILNRPNRAPRIVKFLWAKFHLLFLCGRCSPGTQGLRDILGHNECWWWQNWKKGNYDIPFWMGKDEYNRLSKIRKEKIEEGKPFPQIGSLESAIHHTLSNLFK